MFTMRSFERSARYGDIVKKPVAVLAGIAILAGCGDTRVSGSGSASIETSVATTQLTHEMDTQSLQHSWQEITSHREGDVDIAMIDLTTGHVAEYANTTERFNTASIIKLSILAELLREYQAAGVPASECAQVTEQCANMEVAAPMITQSDNDAAQQLFEYIGDASGLQKFYDQIGATNTTVSSMWGLTQTTAADQLKVVQSIATPGKVLSQEYVTVALKLMDDVEDDQRWGVSGGVPDGVSYELKNGWLPDDEDEVTINSIGYVHSSDGSVRYAIAALTKNSPSQEYAEQTIQQLSAAAYTAAAKK